MKCSVSRGCLPDCAGDTHRTEINGFGFTGLAVSMVHDEGLLTREFSVSFCSSVALSVSPSVYTSASVHFPSFRADCHLL